MPLLKIKLKSPCVPNTRRGSNGSPRLSASSLGCIQANKVSFQKKNASPRDEDVGASDVGGEGSLALPILTGGVVQRSLWGS